MKRDTIDLTGHQYGRLTVLKEVERNKYARRFLCRCECGNETLAYMSNLRTGHKKSCGCLRDERVSQANQRDLTGRRFGSLKVIKRSEKKSKSGKANWTCHCDCGNTADVLSDRLLNGTTSSCGCRRAARGRKLANDTNTRYRVDGVMTTKLKQKVRSDNSTGVKGVVASVNKKGKVKYVASITVKGHYYYLGRFNSLEDAAAARKKGEELYHDPYLKGSDA